MPRLIDDSTLASGQLESETQEMEERYTSELAALRQEQAEIESKAAAELAEIRRGHDSALQEAEEAAARDCEEAVATAERERVEHVEATRKAAENDAGAKLADIQRGHEDALRRAQAEANAKCEDAVARKERERIEHVEVARQAAEEEAEAKLRALEEHHEEMLLHHR